MRRILFSLLLIQYSSFILGQTDSFQKESNKRLPSEFSTLSLTQDGVIMATTTKTSWPELVGMDGEAAKAQLESVEPDKQVFLVPQNAMMTMDYRKDRVRIFVDSEGKVVRAPKIG